MNLHSEQESFRGTLTGRTPENEYTTLIITRRNRRIWVTFDGSIRTTITMTDQDATQLISLLQEAQNRS